MVFPAHGPGIEELEDISGGETFVQEIETGIAALEEIHGGPDVPVVTREDFLVALK